MDDLSGSNGSNGSEAQAKAALANNVLMAGIRAVTNNTQIEHNGKIVNARDAAWNKFSAMVKDNPSYFAGRFSANVGTSAVLSLPLQRGGFLGATAAVVFGTSLQTTASLGAGIRAVENGITNPVDIISYGAYGGP